MQVRLRGSHSPNMGRTEVHCAGTWGSVQASGWDIKDATVAGRQLGYHSASFSCKPSREVSIKRVGEKGTLGSFLSLPLPLSLLLLPSLSSFPSSSSPFLCLPRCPVPVRRVFPYLLGQCISEAQGQVNLPGRLPLYVVRPNPVADSI